MRVSRKLLFKMLDDKIDELAVSQKREKESRERAYDACELVVSLVGQISRLEKEVIDLGLAIALTETRDFNRARRMGITIQEGE